MIEPIRFQNLKPTLKEQDDVIISQYIIEEAGELLEEVNKRDEKINQLTKRNLEILLKGQTNDKKKQDITNLVWQSAKTLINDISKTDLESEIGDVIYLTLRLCSRQNIDPRQTIIMKMDSNKGSIDPDTPSVVSWEVLKDNHNGLNNPHFHLIKESNSSLMSNQNSSENMCKQIIEESQSLEKEIITGSESHHLILKIGNILYLTLQLADKEKINSCQAVKLKIARNEVKYPQGYKDPQYEQSGGDYEFWRKYNKKNRERMVNKVLEVDSKLIESIEKIADIIKKHIQSHS